MNESFTPPPAPPRTDRIVVGVDGSAASRHALRWAVALAQATGSTIDAVLAWVPFTNVGWVGAGFAQMPDGWDPGADAEKALVAAVDDEFGADRPMMLHLATHEGSPTQVLIEASAGAQLLIVGSRGHGGFAGLLLGSVSAACAEHATCPVLVLHGDTAPPTFAGSLS